MTTRKKGANPAPRYDATDYAVASRMLEIMRTGARAMRDLPGGSIALRLLRELGFVEPLGAWSGSHLLTLTRAGEEFVEQHKGRRAGEALLDLIYQEEETER